MVRAGARAYQPATAKRSVTLIYLHGLSTALSPNCLHQSAVAERAAIIIGDKYPQFQRLSKTFEASGVDRRHSVVPIDWFSQHHGWKDRNKACM